MMLGVAILLVTAASSFAQIYSWTDQNGHLVLSNTKPVGDTPVRTFAVEKAQSFRATRSAAPEKVRQYDDLIVDNARQHGVRTDLVRAVVQVESAFNPYARSPKGALGLMQLMPATIRDFGVSNPFNPVENIRAGVAYLRQLLDRYQNNEVLALAAYNAGPAAVDRHGQSVPPYRETKNYVLRVNQAADQPAQERSRNVIYKTVEIVDGRPVVRYTDRKPATGEFEVVK